MAFTTKFDGGLSRVGGVSSLLQDEKITITGAINRHCKYVFFVMI
jgi:hypothetical protein